MGLHRDGHTAVASSSNSLALNTSKIVYSSHADLVPKMAAPDQDEDKEATTARTRAVMKVIIASTLSAVHPATSPTKFVKYKPAARQSSAFNSGAEERILRLGHAQEDPILPPKHRRRRVPRPSGSGSPLATVTHSPPRRPVSRKDMESWKIPPSVSDWKNAKGYCAPLDKRVASSDARRMRQDDVQVSHGFAGLSEALYVAEQKARDAIEMRDKVRRELRIKEQQQQQEQKLREIANEARAAAAAAPAPSVDEKDAKRERDMVREELRREASRGKRSRVTRERDRDVSERIALGMASTGGGAGEVTYDERLFNQETGMGSGFAADDVYNVYSGRLFAAQPAALSALYRPNKNADSDAYGGDADEQLEKISKTERFKPDRVFSGAAGLTDGKRERPVEFDASEERAEAYDLFVELDRYMSRVKEGKKD
ncbi:hypothetical protein HU200_057393 [Digitaria exilis]|uniref:SKI-interacting protein SKIP SNW domain-containing protein n=1 Tax=Digitaria exilis TaxID=1010633 RepID=A0A835E007_9POAL|nr:hypothetical protein HU200_057393 [Digitaria exilis]